MSVAFWMGGEMRSICCNYAKLSGGFFCVDCISRLGHSVSETQEKLTAFVMSFRSKDQT